MVDTMIVSGLKTASSALIFTLPCASTGRYVISNPCSCRYNAGWLTAACSTDVIMMWFPLRLFASAPPISARLSDSVPPDVNRISFSCTFRIPAMVFVASFTYFSASTPLRCMADGFPKSSVIVFTTISFTES